MSIKRIAAFAVLLASLIACEEKEPEKVPTFKSISVSTESIVIDQNESAEISFSVEDKDYAFNYTIGSSDCAVSLSLPDHSTPVDFALSKITAAGDGNYIAVITDKGITSNYNETARLVLTVRNSSGSAVKMLSNEFTVHGRISVKTGLPVVRINTAGEAPIVSKDSYLNATIEIDGVQQYPSLKNMGCRVKGRGNTTWSWPKKPYLVALDSKVSVLGMPKHKRWILLANFMDRTMMRNNVSMHIGSMTSLAWTPRFVPVELVLNGKHVGNYLLIEQIRVDKNRVNISEEEGYLLELDFHYDNKIQWLSEYGRCNQFGNGIPFGIKNPDEDAITQDQINWVKDHINMVASKLYGSSFLDKTEGYAQYLDLQSFADYWIVFEMMGNHELSNPGSVYFTVEKGEKIKAGPLWDFDWGVLSYKTSPQARYGFVNKNAIWYARLFQDPDFVSILKARWTEMYPKLQTIPDYMKECETLLAKSAKLNFAMWNPADDKSQNGGNIINGDENMSYEEASKNLRTVFSERLELLNKLIPAL